MAGGGNQVRIIGGRHRGRRLTFVPARGLRPTPDRVRETLFNWLRAEIPGARCLDLFAGSGAIGFEALSRGAAYVTFVERHRVVAQRLREHIVLLGEQDAAEVRQVDALRLLSDAPGEPFDVVFVDPPFADRLLSAVCERLAHDGWLAADAMVYLEQDAKQAWPDPPVGWRLHREGTAGQSAQRLLQRSIMR